MSDTVESTSQAGNARRRLPRRTRPLVIEGTAQRVEERPLPKPRGISLHDRDVDAHSDMAEGFERRGYFGRRENGGDFLTANLVAEARRAQRGAKTRAGAGRTWSPTKIAMIAGAFLAGLFLLPSLMAFSVSPSAALGGDPRMLGNNIRALVIDDLKADVSQRGGDAVLSVSGIVRNESGLSVAVPPIEVVLTDETGHRVVRNVEIGRGQLRPGKTVGFDSSVIVPAGAGSELSVAILQNPKAAE